MKLMVLMRELVGVGGMVEDFLGDSPTSLPRANNFCLIKVSGSWNNKDVMSRFPPRR